MVTAATLVQQDRPPWLYRRFLKEKLKVEERYWRPLEKDETAEDPIVIVPDGVIWRKYLKLLSQVIENESCFQWVLLESAAELMDWRNVSPCIPTKSGDYIAESAALQERNKIRKLLEDHPAKVQPFCDLSVREEECDEWQVLDYPDMSVVDRSRHALFRAGRFLGASRVVLLVHDNESADETGEMRVLNIDGFMALVEDAHPEIDMEQLLTVKRLCEEIYDRRNTPPDAAAENEGGDGQLTEEQVAQGVRDGNLARGRLEVTKANPKEAYVNAGGVRYFINQEQGHFQRAFHHDVVVVQPLPETEWGRPVGRRRLVHYRAEEDETGTLSGDAGLAVPSARVVSVFAPSRRSYVATLVDPPLGDERAILVVPMDIRIPKIRMQSRGWPTYVNQRLLVEVDGWERNSNYPNGHCTQIIGPIGDLETEVRM